MRISSSSHELTFRRVICSWIVIWQSTTSAVLSDIHRGSASVVTRKERRRKEPAADVKTLPREFKTFKIGPTSILRGLGLGGDSRLTLMNHVTSGQRLGPGDRW